MQGGTNRDFRRCRRCHRHRLVFRRAAVVDVHRVIVVALIMVRRLLRRRIQHVRLRLVQHVRLFRDTQLSAL